MFQKFAKALGETWFFWPFILVLGLMAARETETRQLPPSYDVLVGFVFAFLIALWVTLDARRRERKIGYGFPALVFFIWPIFATIYLFQTRGLRAFLCLLAFLAMSSVTAFIGAGIGLILP